MPTMDVFADGLRKPKSLKCHWKQMSFKSHIMTMFNVCGTWQSIDVYKVYCNKDRLAICQQTICRFIQKRPHVSIVCEIFYAFDFLHLTQFLVAFGICYTVLNKRAK